MATPRFNQSHRNYPQQSVIRRVVRGDSLDSAARPKTARIDWIDVNDINADTYQREILDYKLKRMVREWDPSIVGYVLISLRADGSFFVIDGQHRVEAVRRLQGKIGPMIEAVVREGLTSTEEAHFFAESQDPRRRTALSPEDLHIARMHGGHLDTIAMNNAVAAAGYRIGRAEVGNDTCRLRAINAANKVQERYGAVTLHDALTFIRSVWGTEKSPEASLIHGVAMFMVMFPDANIHATARRMGKEIQEKWLRNAKARADAEHLNNAEGIASYMHTDHNRANRTKQLSNFEETLQNHQATLRSEASYRAKGITR